MLGNFPIWDCSMKGAAYFILTIPNSRMFVGRDDWALRHSSPVFSTEGL